MTKMNIIREIFNLNILQWICIAIPRYFFFYFFSSSSSSSFIPYPNSHNHNSNDVSFIASNYIFHSNKRKQCHFSPLSLWHDFKMEWIKIIRSIWKTYICLVWETAIQLSFHFDLCADTQSVWMCVCVCVLSEKMYGIRISIRTDEVRRKMIITTEYFDEYRLQNSQDEEAKERERDGERHTRKPYS